VWSFAKESKKPAFLFKEGMIIERKSSVAQGIFPALRCFSVQ
jgi:hypothetical protein